MLQPSRQPVRDAIDRWIEAHPWRDGSQDVAIAVTAAEERRRAILEGRAIGSYSVNRALFEELARLEGRAHYAPAPAPEEWTPQARRIRRRVARTLDAWRLAEREFARGLRSSPAFAILDLDAVTARRRSPRIRHLTDEQRARQRHRYKGAAADNLARFARPHLVVDPRHREYRPRWLDHVAGCRGGRGEGRRCSPRCGKIARPPGGRSRHPRRSRRERRDWISVPEWLLDRAAAQKGCQDVVGLRDRTCGGIVVVPQSCHVRTCPDCESARQTRTVKRYQAAVELLDPERTGFLTLTIRNPERDYLAEGYNHLQESIVKLRRRAIWKGGRCRDRTRCRMPWDPHKRGWRLPHPKVTASLTSLETTHSAAAGFNPHAHSIIEGRVDQAELAETWETITGGSRVVWIESVRTYADKKHAGNVEASLRELLKYSAKPSPAFLDHERPAVLAELLVALRGRKLTTATGSLFRTGLDEDPEETDRVLVWPPGNDEARPYHAPRLCPLHDGAGEWEVLAGHRLLRRDTVSIPDRSRPGRQVRTHPPPPE